jgi:hypothetical protein
MGNKLKFNYAQLRDERTPGERFPLIGRVSESFLKKEGV